MKAPRLRMDSTREAKSQVKQHLYDKRHQAHPGVQVLTVVNFGVKR